MPYDKGWKIMKKATCVYEGEYTFLNGKSKVILSKTDWGYPTKNTGN